MTVKTESEISAWYNERVALDPFNPPTLRDVAAFAECSMSKAYVMVQVLEGKGMIAGRRKWAKR